MATNKRLIKSNDEGAGGASFNTVLYTGNGGTKNVTGVGFQPDFVWVKNRDSGTRNHKLFDSVRGVQKFIVSNTTDAEVTDTNALESFDIDGYTTGSDGSLNTLNENYVAWCWKAGGAAVTIPSGTNGSNTDSIVSANVEAGFSIVKYNNPANNPQIVSHGLGKTPSVVITKGTNLSSNWNFMCNIIDGSVDGLELNTTNAKGDLPDAISEHTFSTRYPSSFQSIAYCFAEVAGFSKFGSYDGTGSAGNFVSTSVGGDAGFEPAFLMIKRTEGSGEWIIFDNKRETTSIKQDTLAADSSRAESTNVNYEVEFQSNGFSVNGTSAGINASPETYIYMAFANQF